jgi:recombination protein RecA
MSKIAATAAALQKEFGNNIGGKGAHYEVVDRVPTDWFPFDISTGGGLPRGHVSIIYGPAGSGKTTLSYRLIAQHQRRWPELTCCYLDVENVFSPDWAEKMGVDVENLYVFRPDFVEQAGDVIETLLYSEDCGIVVLDSLAALETSKALEDPMEKVQMGASIPIKRMCNKVTAALRAATKEGRVPPTVIYINQIRTKIGVMFGNPETMPGGHTPQFQSSFTCRMWSKAIKDDKVSKVLPARRELKSAIQKSRVRNLSQNAEWNMNLIEHGGYPVGACADWKYIKPYLEQFNMMSKEKNGYTVVDGEGELHEFATQEAIRDRLRDDFKFMDSVRTAIIGKLSEQVPAS